MLRVSLQSLLSHKLRLILTALAVILGVSFVAGTLIITDTINNTFNRIFKDANSGVAVTVHGHALRGESGGIGGGGNQPVPTSLLASVRGVAGVKNAVGSLFRTGATLIDANGKPIGGNGPPTFGGIWINDSEISPFHLRSGQPPSRPDDVVIDAGTVSKQNLKLGQSISIAFAGGAEQQFHVSGITAYGTSDNLAGATITLFTEATAERVLDGQGKYDAIQASAQSGVSDIDLRDRVAAILPSYAEAATGQQAAAAAQQSTANTIGTFIGTPLLVFAFISLFVGSFLIVNTFNILVAQRTRELALLRALGATRRQVLTSVLAEATATGLVASALGSLLGILIGYGLTALLGASQFGLTLTPRPFIVAIVVGTLITVLAAAMPARRATRIAPVAALREALPETQSLPRLRIISGGIIFLLGCVALGFALFGKTSSTLQLLGAGVLAIFIGVAMLAPLVVRPIATVLGWPIRHVRGAAGNLAGENARRNPRRTALTAAALMIGLALVTSVNVLTDSLRASTDAAISGALKADFIVFEQGPSFSPQVADRMRQDPKLTGVSELRVSPALIGSTSLDIAAVDPRTMSSAFSFTMQNGDATSIATGNTAIVDVAEATSRGLHVGDSVTIGFPTGGDVAMRIGGIYKQNALASGYLVSLATLNPHIPTPRDQIVLVSAASGVSIADAEHSLKQDLTAFPLLQGLSREEYRKLVGTQIDSLLNLIYVLLAFSILIAVLGILNTLVLSVVERVRELGLLRALGMTRFQTSEMIAWESLIISLLGAVLGLAVGVALGIALTSALHDIGIDQLAVPTTQLVFYAVITGVFGVLAAVIPAIRAARVDMLQAITTE